MVERILSIEHRPHEGLVLRMRVPKTRHIPKEAVVHIRAARKEMLLPLHSILGTSIALIGEVAGHMRATRKEMLLALRSILDAGIAGIDEEEKENTTRGKKRKVIQVE